MAQSHITVRIIIDNPKAVRAVRDAADALADLQESMPWSDEVKQAVKAMRYAMRHMRPEKDRRK